MNDRFHGRAPLEILRFAREAFGERAAILCSMQRACTALCHMADEGGLDFDVIFVDTGVLHPETLATRDALAAAHPRLRVITLHPERSMAEQTAAEGVLYLSREGQELCCELRKTSPLLTLRGRYHALIGTLRRHEGGARTRVEPFGLDAAMGGLRIDPFADLDPGALDAYLAGHRGVVVNPLHAMGFPSIGCFPCTTPVLPDEPERAGRWRHLASVSYCGINPVDRGDEGAVELDERYAPLFR